MAGTRVRRVRRRPVDEYDRAGRQVAEVLRAADIVAETTRQQTEEWVRERHVVVDRELASRHDQAAALEKRAERVLADAEERLADAETRARDAVELQERAAERVRLAEAERRERAEVDRREAERVMAKAKAHAAGIVSAAQQEATDLLQGVLADQQKRLDHLHAEEERTTERMESLLGAMPVGEDAARGGPGGQGPAMAIDLREEESTDPEPPLSAEDPTPEFDPTPALDPARVADPQSAADDEVLVATRGTDLDHDLSLRLVDGLEEGAVADIVQSAVDRAVGRSPDNDDDVAVSGEPSPPG